MTWRTDDLTLTLSTLGSGGVLNQIVATVTCGGFSAIRASALDTEHLERFAQQVDQMYQDLAGQAELTGEYGLDFSVRLTASSGGHVDVDVSVNEAHGHLRLECRTDQTFLPALRDGLESII